MSHWLCCFSENLRSRRPWTSPSSIPSSSFTCCFSSSIFSCSGSFASPGIPSCSCTFSFRRLPLFSSSRTSGCPGSVSSGCSRRCSSAGYRSGPFSSIPRCTSPSFPRCCCCPGWLRCWIGVKSRSLCSDSYSSGAGKLLL